MLRKNAFTVRCYVKREQVDADQSAWVAVCIDLGLAAQGETEHEARRLLEEQVLDYVQEAFTVDIEHAVPLLALRRAPISQQLEYHYIRAKNALMRFLLHRRLKSEDAYPELLNPLRFQHAN